MKMLFIFRNSKQIQPSLEIFPLRWQGTDTDMLNHWKHDNQLAMSSSVTSKIMMNEERYEILNYCVKFIYI